MSVDARIVSGRDKTYAAEVDLAHRLQVLAHPVPPPPGGRAQPMRVFRQHLTDDGLVTDGSNQDMRVNGSSTNVDFYVPASDDADRYICILSFQISDALASLNSFGTITALTNGCRLFYEDELGEVDIHNSLKSNFNFVRLALGDPAFGDGNNSFRANNVAGNSEGFLPVVDLRRLFGFQWGVRLRQGSTQRLTLRVRDDTSAVDAFDCIAYGFERFPDEIF